MNGYEYIVEFLRNEGFRFTEEENHIFLKFHGSNFVFFKNDSIFVQITQILNTEKYSFDRCLRIANEMNGNKFVIKYTVNDNGSVWVSYEFIPNSALTADDYEMIFDYIDKSSDDFFEKIEKED